MQWDFHRDTAIYASWKTGTKFRQKDAVLGHGRYGCSEHWNIWGHKQPRSANLAWNRRVETYGGAEERSESASSGAAAPPYRVPILGESHESWCD